MKLLTLMIGEAFECILNFDGTPRVRSYLVQNDGGNIHLFGLPSYKPSRMRSQLPSMMVQMDSGPQNVFLYKYEETPLTPSTGCDRYVKLDFYLYGVDASAQRVSGHRYQEMRAAERSFWDQVQLDSLHMNEGNGFVWDMPENNVQRFDVTFHLSMLRLDGVYERERSFRLYAVPERQIENVSLDFGSEASQLMVYNQNDDPIAPGACLQELFHYYRGKFDPSSSANDKDYMQYDPDLRLFRSHFMVPKRMSVPYEPAASPVTNTPIKFLLKYTDPITKSGDYISLPNVKFVETGAVSATVIDNLGDEVPVQTYGGRYFYRRVINTFLFRALESVSVHARQRDAAMFLRLYVLMPNIYSQSEVSEIVGQIESDLETILASGHYVRHVPGSDEGAVEVAFKDRIIGVEVNSVSESDASFLGYHFAQPTHDWDFGRYLIMDAGKGTLDFSVIDYNDANERGTTPVTCIYRSGIIGSGNALSYALFLDILNAMIAPYLSGLDPESAMSDIIKTVIEHGDESYLADLMRLVDKYKIVYSENAFIGPAAISAKPGVKLSDFDLPTIVKGVGDMLDTSEIRGFKLPEYPYLNAMLKTLATDAMKELEYNGRLNYVILAGRGFLFEPFKQAMLEELRGRWPELNEIPFDDGGVYTMKNSCLFASVDISLGNYDGKRIGIPILVHTGRADYDDETGTPEAPVKRKFWEGALEGLLDWIENRFGGKNPLDDMRKMELKDYLNGKKMKVKSARDKVCISGSYYAFTNTVRGDVTLFFDGEDFLYRHDGKMHHFGPARARTTRHYYESTFPYDSRPVIPFPHL